MALSAERDPLRVPGAPDRGSAAAVDRPHPRRFLILGICCMSLFIVGLDNTVVNVALPSIQVDLHASTAELQWTVSAYLLVLASLLMLSGSTADRLGRARIFQLGLILFTLGSLLCSLAPNVKLLIASRMLQAVGGSMLNPVALSIIRNTFHDPRERAQAIGIWGGVVGVSMALGPVIGGVLVEAVSWRSIFWINLPVGIVAVLLTARFVPESRGERVRRIDPVGQLLVIVLLASLLYAIIEAPSAGWRSAQTLVLAAVAAVALATLVVYERRRSEPLIEVRFFRSVPFSGAGAIALISFAGLGGFLFLNTIYLQVGRGLSPLSAGLYTLPMAAMTVVGGPLSGRLVGRRGPRPSLVIGGVAIAVSSLMLVRLRPDTPEAWLLLSYVIFGIGFGWVNPPITNTAVSGMPAGQAGVASAIASTSRQIGQALGVAVVGAIAVVTVAGPTRLAAASHAGWWIVAGLGVAIVVVGILSTSRWARGTAAHLADELEG